MNSSSTTTSQVTSALRTPSGNYAMLALDQRESMRAMFGQSADGAWADDQALRDFKSEAVRILTPSASAVLLDRPYSVDGVRPAGLADGCGLIVAADVLHQETGGNVTGSSFDDLVTVDFLKTVGADAIKFLVIWRAGSGQAERAELVQRAIELARTAGVASLVEAIVRTDDDSPWASHSDRHEAIIAAAEEIAPFGADVYKAEVPGYIAGDLSKVTEHSERLTAVVPNDWVVLSNGVDRPDFAGAVAAARAGGANGFLAGRAIWADVIGHDDTSDQLRQLSIPRLNELTAIVDAR